MAEGHGVWRATSRREKLSYFESKLWLNLKGGKEAPAVVLFHPIPNKKARMNEEEEETNSPKDLIQNLTANMESNFAKLHEELCSLRQEMKEEVDTLESNIKSVEKSVDEYGILQKELQMDTAQIRFHAVYRIDKRKDNKHRPIIAPFVCR